jgi:RNA polymerase sigma-70 factor (ECF subfamily)
MADAESFESLRPVLLAIAYRMLGSVSDAEDTVQDAFVRYQRAFAEGARIESTKSYLCAVVTRLAIDALRSARARRESYVGQWLPEPVVTDSDPFADSERSESISMAFLLLLERLGPVERAVFLLHDVFGHEHGEVASIVGKSEDNCRQLLRRARKHIDAGRPRFEPRCQARDELARRFFAAMSEGKVDAVLQLVADDAVVYGDGGGKAPQWSKPITGRAAVARLVAGVGARLGEFGARFELCEINGQSGAKVFDRDQRLVNVFSLDIADGAVRVVRSVINPDKLRHLGPVADVRAHLKPTTHDDGHRR